MPADPDLLAQGWDFPSRQLHDQKYGSGSHIYRAGGATEGADMALRNRGIFEHVRRVTVLGSPADRHPARGPPTITEALELADAAAVAYRIVGRTFSRKATESDAAVGAFMRTVDNIDMAVENLASDMSGSHSNRVVAAQRGHEQACIHLRETLICSAADFRQSGSSNKSWPCASVIRSCHIAHHPPRTTRPPTRRGC
jgi:hypothetical protein